MFEPLRELLISGRNRLTRESRLSVPNVVLAARQRSLPKSSLFEELPADRAAGLASAPAASAAACGEEKRQGWLPVSGGALSPRGW